MSENVGSIVYEVDANTNGLVAAQNKVTAANSTMQKSFSKTDSSVGVMQKKMASAEVGGKKFGNSMRQASMQLSQVAQQGSVTGNYLQALAIQLPDLALGFGTVGIIAGALAGTVGIGLLNAFTGADESIDDLEETLKTLGSTFETVAGESNQLAKSLKELQAVSRSAVELRIAVQTQDAEAAIKKAGEFIFESLADGLSTNTFIPIFGLEKILAIGSSASGALEGVAREAGITTKEMAALAEASSSAKFDQSAESYENLAAVVLSLKKKYGDSNEAVNEFSKDLSEQIPVALEAINTLKKLKSASEALGGDGSGFTAPKDSSDAEGDRLAALFETRKAANAATLEQIRTQFQDEQTLAEEQLGVRLNAIDATDISIAEKEQAEIEARSLHAQKLADIDAKRTANEQSEAAKRLTLKKMEVSAYTQLGDQLTNLVAAAGAENSAIGKAVFLANQALAVAGIIVNTQAAAAATLPLDPTGSLSARVTALGYTSAAIAGGVAVGQTFSGRQTGGPTEANSTYRVNEAGGEGFQFKSGGREFIQTLGGNGKVIPANEMNQGGSAPQISINVINQNGSNVNVSQEQDGNNVTIQMLVADWAEGGPVSRAAISNTNIKRKTT